jgi:uncharacterized protein (TIGR03089 family)
VAVPWDRICDMPTPAQVARIDAPEARHRLITCHLAMTYSDAILTYYDDATGERTALSAAELGGWAAATAALLSEGCGLGPGSRVAIRLPPHWQTAAVLLGAWSAGAEVAYQSWARAGLGGPDPAADAAFVSSARARSLLEDPVVAEHRFVLGLAPHAGPTPEVPGGYRDYLAELRPYAAAGPPTVVLRPGDPASPDGTTYGEWGAVAVATAEMQGIGPGDRVLIDAARSEEPLQWLLAPLSVGAAIVLCANLDPADVRNRATAERVSRIL